MNPKFTILRVRYFPYRVPGNLNTPDGNNEFFDHVNGNRKPNLWLRFGLLMALAMLLLSLGACTSIGHIKPPDDRPRLTVREHAVMPAVAWQKCYATVPLWAKLLGAVPEGCAWIRFDTMTCDIYLPSIDGTVAPWALEHEREHCRLRDHHGSTQLADAWAAWKAHMLTGAGAYVYVRHDGETVAVERK
jgi:hypothetical protein